MSLHLQQASIRLNYTFDCRPTGPTVGKASSVFPMGSIPVYTGWQIFMKQLSSQPSSYFLPSLRQIQENSGYYQVMCKQITRKHLDNKAVMCVSQRQIEEFTEHLAGSWRKQEVEAWISAKGNKYN